MRWNPCSLKMLDDLLSLSLNMTMYVNLNYDQTISLVKDEYTSLSDFVSYSNISCFNNNL